MLEQRVLLVCLLAAFSAAPTFADSMVRVDLPTRGRGAEHIVVAEVVGVQPVYHRNEFGDELIVSRTTLRVSEAIKGAADRTAPLVIDVEGGTIGEITLRVSDLPRLTKGERAVFFLGRSRQGRLVPHLRGLGILKLDASGRVQGTDLTVERVRRLLDSRE